MKKITKKIENIKKKTTNDEKMLKIKMLEIKTLKIKMKFYATNEISEHDDLMKHEDFFLIFKMMSVSIQFNIQSHDL